MRFPSSKRSMIPLVILSVLWSGAALAFPSVPALVPADSTELPTDWMSFLGEGESSHVFVTASGDTVQAVYLVEFAPYGESVVVLIDPESAGFPGFAIIVDQAGAIERKNFWASGEFGWWLWELVEVAVADLDEDGFTDILITAEYCTGIGPEGARPFRAVSVTSGSDFSTYFMEERTD